VDLVEDDELRLGDEHRLFRVAVDVEQPVVHRVGVREHDIDPLLADRVARQSNESEPRVRCVVRVVGDTEPLVFSSLDCERCPTPVTGTLEETEDSP